ncbi:MAG: sugar ABC transporter substrate-binding protein, partial [Hyphomicrobiales bacterium]|nr:sugar ABC transporter substrate-binding protein [Hyphomicrobiales bacterium]
LQKKEHPHVVKITPVVWDNSDAGLSKLKAAYNPKLDPFYSVAIDVKPYTQYNMDQILACKGP